MDDDVVYGVTVAENECEKKHCDPWQNIIARYDVVNYLYRRTIWTSFGCGREANVCCHTGPLHFGLYHTNADTSAVAGDVRQRPDIGISWRLGNDSRNSVVWKSKRDSHYSSRYFQTFYIIDYYNIVYTHSHWIVIRLPLRDKRW